MTMQTSQDLQGPSSNRRFREKRSGDRFYGAQGRGAGLYAEVRPVGDSRPLTLETADDTR